jgi:ABC-type proline/glycine betaine transport system ATPase subunit
MAHDNAKIPNLISKNLSVCISRVIRGSAGDVHTHEKFLKMLVFMLKTLRKLRFLMNICQNLGIFGEKTVYFNENFGKKS